MQNNYFLFSFFVFAEAISIVCKKNEMHFASNAVVIFNLRKLQTRLHNFTSARRKRAIFTSFPLDKKKFDTFVCECFEIKLDGN